MLLSCDRPPQRRVNVLVLILSHHEFSLSLHVSITVRCLSVTNTPVAERAGPLVSATIFHLTLTLITPDILQRYPRRLSAFQRLIEML